MKTFILSIISVILLPQIAYLQYVPSVPAYTAITREMTSNPSIDIDIQAISPTIAIKQGSFSPFLFKNKKANKIASNMLTKENVPEVYERLKDTLGVEVATRFLLVIATESGGNWRSTNRNRNGSTDCGLLQINQRGTCTEKSFSTDWQASQAIAKYRYNKFKPWYGAWYHRNLFKLVGVRAVWNVV